MKKVIRASDKAKPSKAERDNKVPIISKEDLGELHGPFNSMQELREYFDALDLGDEENDESQ